ncbi:MAG: DUF2339 domain-containing protein [Hyphomicrobiaceae bacterium]
MEILLIAALGFSLLQLWRRMKELEARARRSDDLIERLALDFACRRRTQPGLGTEPTPDSASEPGIQPVRMPEAPFIGPEPAVPPVPEPVQPEGLAARGIGSVPPVPQRPISLPSLPSWVPRPGGAAGNETFEERLGTRWAVWVGGLALALGGLLMVRFAIEEGYLGPAARVLSGAVFSCALIAAGEWFRRAERADVIASIPAAHIPGILTAAGTSTAFGTIYAAHALYGFIGPGVAFVALGAVAIATMLAAALHGPALAGLGLLGGYVAPLLVTSAAPNPWALVVYLAAVAASALGLSRIRAWHWLAGLAVGGAAFWGLPILEQVVHGASGWRDAGHVHVLVQLVLAVAYLIYVPALQVPDREARVDPAASGMMAVLAVLTILFLVADRGDAASVVVLTTAGAAVLLVAAWSNATLALGAALAGVVVLGGALAWPGAVLPPAVSALSAFSREAGEVLRLPSNAMGLVGFACLSGLGVAFIATLRLFRGRDLPAETVAVYAASATLTPLLVLASTYLRVEQLATSTWFGLLGVLLAVIFAFAAERFQNGELDDFPGTRLATGVFSSAAITSVCLGMGAGLDSRYLVTALALAAAGTAYVAGQKGIRALRHVVAAIALLVLARIGWDPQAIGAAVGSWPLLNWLIVGYAIPAGAFWYAAQTLESDRTSTASQMAYATAILLAALFMFFEIHHALHGGDMLAAKSGHVEQGLLAIVAFGMSFALLQLGLGKSNPVFRIAEMVFGLISAAIVVVGLGLVENPYFSREAVVGPPVLSSLLLAYLLPGAAAAVLARAVRPHRPGWYTGLTAVLALGLIFMYVTLEVRHVFHGEHIGMYQARAGGAEHWVISMSWLALGIAFLAYGVWRRSLEARFGSAVVVLMAVAKVFLFDLAGLTGIWRALSFIALGIVLIGIGLVYQNFVFAKGSKPLENQR